MHLTTDPLIERQCFPRTAELYGGYVPFHDSFWTAVRMVRGESRGPGFEFEWWFYDRSPDCEYSLTGSGERIIRNAKPAIYLHGVSMAKFEAVYDNYFLDGSVTYERDKFWIRLI